MHRNDSRKALKTGCRRMTKEYSLKCSDKPVILNLHRVKGSLRLKTDARPQVNTDIRHERMQRRRKTEVFSRTPTWPWARCQNAGERHFRVFKFTGVDDTTKRCHLPLFIFQSFREISIKPQLQAPASSPIFKPYFQAPSFYHCSRWSRHQALSSSPIFQLH